MAKSKTITEMVTDLQLENESLRGLQRLANMYTKQEFGYTVEQLHEIIDKYRIYENRISEYGNAKQGQQPSINA